jgi:hypothetical protein
MKNQKKKNKEKQKKRRRKLSWASTLNSAHHLFLTRARGPSLYALAPTD